MIGHPQDEHEQHSSAGTSASDGKLEEGTLGCEMAQMQLRWADVKQGWEDLKRKMHEIGMTMTSSTVSSGMVQLNVGGSNLDIPRSVFERMNDSQEDRCTLGDLFGAGAWDKRLPVSADGRIVLDESPTCVEFLINATPMRSGTVRETPGLLAGVDLPADELPYLHHVAGVLGFATQSLPLKGMTVLGGSTALEAGEVGDLTTKLQEWLPGESGELELLYRASRDGWTPQAFHGRCDNVPDTISVFRVRRRDGEISDSVVGGFSSSPWESAVSSYYRVSPGSFLFVLGDGSSSCQPRKWGLKDDSKRAIYCRDIHGPHFGSRELAVCHLNGTSSCSTLWVSARLNRRFFMAPSTASLHVFKERVIVELEVFRLWQTASRPPLPAPPTAATTGKGVIDCATFSTADSSLAEEHDNDVLRFGVSIAESLQEERAALHHAQTEGLRANVNAAAAATALAAIYGPDVARGKEETVIDLSVRGTSSASRMTTLLSTLQACPDSALAARFDGRWKADRDANGREVINDCNPGVFSKVLDVLRMRKRAARAATDKDEARIPPARVIITDSNRASFETFVDMWFPGCESFIMECVTFWPAALA